MVLERQRTGGVGVLERPPVLNILKEPEESDEKDLENARSSLTVIENPSLDGYLTILMARTAIPYDRGKAFLDVYFITAGEDYKVVSQRLRQRGARSTTKQVDGQLLYIISDEYNEVYPIASLVPHEPCRITAEEFKGFENALAAGNLEGVVDSMSQLIGQRLTEKGFAYKDGKLVLPETYANIRL